MQLEHPHAPSVWETIELTDSGVKNVLIVETDLILKPEEFGNDPVLVADLRSAAMEYLDQNRDRLDKVYFLQIRKA
jgi:hypothetical protein